MDLFFQPGFFLASRLGKAAVLQADPQHVLKAHPGRDVARGFGQRGGKGPVPETDPLVLVIKGDRVGKGLQGSTEAVVFGSGGIGRLMPVRPRKFFQLPEGRANELAAVFGILDRDKRNAHLDTGPVGTKTLVFRNMGLAALNDISEIRTTVCAGACLGEKTGHIAAECILLPVPEEV